MAMSRHAGAFVGGLLVGNSAPHLATAAAWMAASEAALRVNTAAAPPGEP